MPRLSFIRDFANLCYPPICAVCDAQAARWPLCDDCASKLACIESHAYCDRCAMPLAERGAPCPHCLGKGLYPFDRVLRLCNFDEPVRHLIHRLKFHHGWSLGEFLADRLFAREAVRQLLDSADAIVPVPLHPLRQIARGYNQAKVIARRLARLSHKCMIQPAIRLVHTSAQTAVQSRAQRLENLHHAFGLLDPGRVAGRRLVVLDDVRTTAATLQSFGRCLKQGNPASIDAIVVAVADWHNANFEKI